jgi:hypothetical protein
MDHAATDDYFSFMSSKSDKTGSNPTPQTVRAVPPVKAIARLDMADRVQPSQMEVTESALTDTGIQRIFGRPNP